MRSGSLLLFFAATLCAVEEVDVKASFQEEAAPPSFRNGRRLFAAEQNGEKTSSVMGEKAISEAGALGTVFGTGPLGSLVAASSAAYLLLSQFVTLKNNDGMHAHARELSGGTRGLVIERLRFPKATKAEMQKELLERVTWDIDELESLMKIKETDTGRPFFFSSSVEEVLDLNLKNELLNKLKKKLDLEENLVTRARETVLQSIDKIETEIGGKPIGPDEGEARAREAVMLLKSLHTDLQRLRYWFH